jgi:hypothetical protein
VARRNIADNGMELLPVVKNLIDSFCDLLALYYYITGYDYG